MYNNKTVYNDYMIVQPFRHLFTYLSDYIRQDIHVRHKRGMYVSGILRTVNPGSNVTISISTVNLVDDQSPEAIQSSRALTLTSCACCWSRGRSTRVSRVSSTSRAPDVSRLTPRALKTPSWRSVQELDRNVAIMFAGNGVQVLLRTSVKVHLANQYMACERRVGVGVLLPHAFPTMRGGHGWVLTPVEVDLALVLVIVFDGLGVEDRVIVDVLTSPSVNV